MSDTAPRVLGTSDGLAQPEIDHSSESHEANLVEDPNPRSPKRRRLTEAKDEEEDEGGIDFEAAAARAMEMSLGADYPPSDQTAIQRSGPENQPQSARGPATLVLSTYQARIDQLPTLDDLATQILSTLAKMSHTEIGEMLFGPLQEKRQEYQNLKSKFDQAKGVYIAGSPFISPQALNTKEASQIDTLRKVNMATFMANIFSGEIGLRAMDMNFLDVFVPENGRLLKAQASIYLELKTQAFIAAKRTPGAMLDQVMLELFSADVEKHLLAKRPGGKSLAPSELDFLKRLASRRDILYTDIRNKRLDNLESRYRWNDFSREVNSYLTKYFDQFISPNRDKPERSAQSPVGPPLQQDQMESQFSILSNQSQLPMATTAPTLDLSQDVDMAFDLESFMARAARAAEIGVQDNGFTSPHNQVVQPHNQTVHLQQTPSLLPQKPLAQSSAKPSPTPATPPIIQSGEDPASSPRTEFQQYRPAADTEPDKDDTGLGEAEGDVPHKSQTAPTQVLYERARQVTTNKALPSSRKPNAPSHRRPWTHEEENALMTGLDEVKGPHWSQILAMYGPGGTVNESLKDRNQVQLKDKARNLKLFFLKAGIEVPYYLKAVTGDLKTRAPGQVEKREAKKRVYADTEVDDGNAPRDESPTDLVDESEEITQSAAVQEDGSGSATAAYQAANEQDEDTMDTMDNETNERDDFDMEAMLARAAASAEQSVGYPWD